MSAYSNNDNARDMQRIAENNAASGGGGNGGYRRGSESEASAYGSASARENGRERTSRRDERVGATVVTPGFDANNDIALNTRGHGSYRIRPNFDFVAKIIA